MTVLVILLVVLVLAGVGVAVRRGLARRRARELETANSFRLSRRAASEDVTEFGEELTELHFETLTTDLDEPMRKDYQKALDRYEDAKARLVQAGKGADITEVTHTLEDGRFALACVLARQDGLDLPARRPPCFFNPTHGPAQSDVEWAPPGGVEREIPICFRCRERLAADERPDVRTVRWGNRRVAWFQAGPAYSDYARGYYGSHAFDGSFPVFILWSVGLGDTYSHQQTVDWTGWDGGSGNWDDGFGTYDWGGWHGSGQDGGGGGGDGGGDGGGWGDGGGGGGDGG